LLALQVRVGRGGSAADTASAEMRLARGDDGSTL
jgi:hypothetical protein